MEPAQLQEVGFPSQSDVAGTRSEEERSEPAADPHQEAAAAKTSPSLDKRGSLFVLGSNVVVPQERSPSPEYSDAVQEQQSMGETATTRGETNQVCTMCVPEIAPYGLCLIVISVAVVHAHYRALHTLAF